MLKPGNEIQCASSAQECGISYIPIVLHVVTVLYETTLKIAQDKVSGKEEGTFPVMLSAPEHYFGCCVFT